MTYYLSTLLLIFITVGLHSLYKLLTTKEWIYQYFTPIFLTSALGVGLCLR